MHCKYSVDRVLFKEAVIIIANTLSASLLKEDKKSWNLMSFHKKLTEVYQYFSAHSLTYKALPYSEWYCDEGQLLGF